MGGNTHVNTPADDAKVDEMDKKDTETTQVVESPASTPQAPPEAE